MGDFWGYEDSPAARLVATHCASCHRPLVDAASVQAGLGPECRRKYGVNPKCSNEEREEANKLIYLIAAKQTGIDVAMASARLRQMGFDKLADIIDERVADVFIHDAGNGYKVTWIYDPARQPIRLAAFKTIPGRRWMGPPAGEEKLWFVPYQSKSRLWEWIQIHFECRIVIGPRGPFTVAPRC